MSEPRYSEMPYWRDRPEEWLLDDRLTDLAPEVFAGFFWIRQRGRRQNPPGVFPGDEAVLLKWSRLPAEIWEARRGEILSLFEGDDAGNFHDPPTKEEFRSYQKLCWEKRLGAQSRYQKGKGKNPERFVDPYENAKTAGKNKAGSICTAYALHPSDRSNDREKREIDPNGVTPPPLGGGEATQEESVNAGAFLKEMFPRKKTSGGKILAPATPPAPPSEAADPPLAGASALAYLNAEAKKEREKT